MPIKFAELVARVQSGKITAEEAERYFRLGAELDPHFEPIFAINEDEVDVRGVEQTARLAGNALAYEASRTTKPQMRAALGAPTPNGTIVAEGDSWFNLPDAFVVPKTIVDFLARQLPVNNIARWGDTLSQIVAAGEHVAYLNTQNVKYFLLSAGGNDALGGGRLADFIRQRQSGDNDPGNAAYYVRSSYYAMAASVAQAYASLLENVIDKSPATKTLIHGYDYCLPRVGGLWLGEPLLFRGFHPVFNRDLARAIIRILVDDFNTRLKTIANRLGSRVIYVNLRGQVGENEWWDELHPREAAAERMAALFRSHITPVLMARATTAAPAGTSLRAPRKRSNRRRAKAA